jgi:hypothetical protein
VHDRAYTAIVSDDDEEDRDIVRELHDDAEWSSWTNTFERWRGRPRGPHPSDPSVLTFMLAAILVAAVVLGAIGLVVFLFSLR